MLDFFLDAFKSQTTAATAIGLVYIALPVALSALSVMIALSLKFLSKTLIAPPAAMRALRRTLRLGRFELHVRITQMASLGQPPRHPFNIWMLLPPQKGAGSRPDLSSATFLLVPDRLANYDLAYALLFFVMIACLSECPLWAITSFAMLWLILPTATHLLIVRAKVYKGLRAHVPDGLTHWFTSLPSKVVTAPCGGNGDGSAAAAIRGLHVWGVMVWHRLKFFKPRATCADPIYTQASGSPQAAFLALGLAAHFAPDQDETNNAASRGFLRFFFHYCTPIWLSFIWLIITFLLMGSTPPLQVGMAFGWAFISMLFIYRAVIQYGTWLDHQTDADDSLRTLPYAPIWRAGACPPHSLHVLRDRWVRTATSVITSVALIIALTALQILKDPTKKDDASSLAVALYCLICTKADEPHGMPRD